MADAPSRNRVLARWECGAPVFCGWVSTGCPLVAETIAAAGFDAIIIDMQHSAVSLDDTISAIAVIELRGAEAFVRVPSLDQSLIGRLIDFGATGIIVPMVENAAQAETIVSSVRYPPAGSRSFGPRRSQLRFSDNPLNAERNIVTLAMIENSSGLVNLEQILRVAALDGVFIGPSDLSIALGEIPSPRPSEMLERTIANIRVSAANAGCKAGIFGGSAEGVRLRAQQGFDLVTATPDIAMVARAAADELRTFKELIQR